MYDSAFDEFLIHVVTITPVSGKDGMNAPVLGTPYQVQGRVEHDLKLVRDDKGREVASATSVYLKPTTTTGAAYAIGQADKLTLPAGCVPLEPPIISVQPHHDETGLHHVEVRA